MLQVTETLIAFQIVSPFMGQTVKLVTMTSVSAVAVTKFSMMKAPALLVLVRHSVPVIIIFN